MDKVEIVDRPTSTTGNKHNYPYDEIAATANTGKAVRIPMNGLTRASLAALLKSGLNTRGYKTHTHDPKDGTLIVWAEKRA